MRRVTLLIIVFVLFTAPAALAVEEGILALSPEAGYAVLTGNLGEMVSGDLLYGASLSYGALDWLGVTGLALYSSHQQFDEDETGEIDLTHFVVGIGPRFHYNTRLVIPYAALLGAMSFIKYKAKWEIGDKTFEDAEDAHGFGGAVEAGLDFFAHDLFTIGLCGRAGYFTGNLEYTNQDADAQELGGYTWLAATVKMSVLF